MADAPTYTEAQAVVYRWDFMKQHYEPLKERLEAKGLAQASQSLDDLIYPLITGPEIALLLAEDCLTVMSTPHPPADATVQVRGFTSTILTDWTGHLALEAAVRTLHCSGDLFGQMLNAAGLVPQPLVGDYYASDVLKAFPEGDTVKRAFGDFLNSKQYLHVGAITNELKHRQLVRTTYRAWASPGEPPQSNFYLQSFERNGEPYPETDPKSLRTIIDEFRERGGSVMDAALAALQ